MAQKVVSIWNFILYLNNLLGFSSIIALMCGDFVRAFACILLLLILYFLCFCLKCHFLTFSLFSLHKNGEIIATIENLTSYWIEHGIYHAGDIVVSAPMIDLQQDPVSGQPRLALALTPLQKLHANNPDATKKNKRPTPIEPPTDVAFTATVKAPKGGLEVVNGKFILPRDVATVVGPSVFLDVAVGRFATEENDALAKSVKEYSGKVPVRGNLYSDRAQAEGLGFVSLRRGQVQLLRPLKAEVGVACMCSIFKHRF